MELVGRADPALDTPLADVLEQADVVVDFSLGEHVPANVAECVRAGVHAVVGATGFDLEELRSIVESESADGARCFVAPNFAIGAVLMMQLSAQAAKHMPECEIVELHHDRKLDAPSGTAKRTADLIREAGGNVHEPIHSVRLPGLVAHQEVHLRRRGPDALDSPRLDRPQLVHARSASGDQTRGGPARPARGRPRKLPLDMPAPRRRLAAALVLGLLAFAGCGGDDDAPEPAQADPVRLDVLVYNVEYGGGPATDRVIRRVDADVVGVLESYDRLPEIAEKTGYPYYNISLQLLSKYPIHEPSGGDGLYAPDRGAARLRDPVLQRPPRLRRVGPARAAERRVGRSR